MDVEIFKKQFLPFHPKLYRIAYALVENQADAEDILQEAYCKLWNKRDELEGILNPEAFSVTLVKNLCLDFLRSPRARHNEKEESLKKIVIATDSSPEKEQEEKDDIRYVQKLIEQQRRWFPVDKKCDQSVHFCMRNSYFPAIFSSQRVQRP